MKTRRQTENTRFIQSVGRALRRAAKAARKTAKMVWHTHLRVGKRQGGGKETLSFGLSSTRSLVDAARPTAKFLQLLRQRSAHSLLRKLQTPRVLTNSWTSTARSLLFSGREAQIFACLTDQASHCLIEVGKSTKQAVSQYKVRPWSVPTV